MSSYVPGQTITEEFYEYKGTTGLALVDFTVNIFKDGAVFATTPTLVEIGNGYYVVSFVPPSVGDYSIDIFRTSDSRAHYTGKFPVREAFATAADLALVQTAVNTNSTGIANNATAIANVQSSVDALDIELDDIPTVSEIVLGVLEAPAEGRPVGSLGQYIERTKKYATNKVITTGTRYTVYEDDHVATYEEGVAKARERTPDP